MSEGNCAQDRQMETGTITKGVSTGTLDSAVCYKVGNIVTVSGRIHTMSGVSAGTDNIWFNIPNGFRPRTGTFVSGYMMINELDRATPLLFTIYADGTVRAGYSSSMHANQVTFSGTYSI